MYIIKTKGTSKIPDFIQIRDYNFILVEHCTTKNLNKLFSKTDYINNFNEDEFTRIPYGVIFKIF